jgi:hypothetical protein
MDRLEDLLRDLAANDDLDFIRPSTIPCGIAEKLAIEVTWKDGSTCRYYQRERYPFHWEIGVAHEPSLTE